MASDERGADPKAFDTASETIRDTVKRESWSGDAVDPRPGARLGPYLLREPLGQGGGGTVYLAEQLEPVRRPVALKLLRGTLLEPRHIARFAVEQQALAQMSHPAIAQVYDAGMTPEGRPYFAMEHVPGEPITEFCRHRGLALRARLELFLEVCWGVQHAHQKGLIHRDLKPSNILVRMVEGRPIPKIIDFGIATTIGTGSSTGSRPEPGRRQLAGTPQYMSPEQADVAAGDLDTRSDVFSLGVVLYELVTGTTPFDGERLSRATWAEIGRVLRDEEVERPSRRLPGNDRELAGLGASARERRAVLRDLSTELDWIVTRAMARDRNDRYPTAAALAEDLRAFLAGEIVQAVPPTPAYRLRKLARRHFALLAAGTAVAVALAIGLTLATWGLFEARAQRDRALEAEASARVEAAKSEQTAAFTQEMLAGVDPAVAGAQDKALLRMILESAAARVETELGEQPEVAAAILATIGVTYRALGEYAAARDHLRSALALREEALGGHHPDTLATQAELAQTLRRQGLYPEAESLLATALAGLRESRGAEHEDTLSALTNLGALQMLQGRFEEAEWSYLEAIDGSRRVLGPDNRQTLTAMNNLALLYSDLGRFEEAEPLYLEVLEASRRAFGPEHPDTLNSLQNLAAMLEMQGRFEEAEELYLEALEGSRAVLGPEHPETLNLMNNIGVLYGMQGRVEDAAALYGAALEARRRTLGNDHPDTLLSMHNLAFALRGLDRHPEALALLAEAVEGARRALPPDHPETAMYLAHRGLALLETGRLADAEAALLEAHRIQYAVLGADHPRTRGTASRLAELYERWGREAEAARWRPAEG